MDGIAVFGGILAVSTVAAVVFCALWRLSVLDVKFERSEFSRLAKSRDNCESELRAIRAAAQQQRHDGGERLKKVEKERDAVKENAREALEALKLSRATMAVCRQLKDGFEDALRRIADIAGESLGPLACDWSRPIIVGDPERDPLSLEISFCGPQYIAVYERHWGDVRHFFGPNIVGFSASHVSIHSQPSGDQVLRTTNGVGIARVEKLERITDAVRRYNEAFHQSKGVEDVGAQSSDRGGDRDRGPRTAETDRDPGPESEVGSGEAGADGRAGRANSPA